MHGEYRRFAKSGPGGRKCGCCYPQEGKARKQFDRLAKKRWKIFTQRLMKESLEQSR